MIEIFRGDTLILTITPENYKFKTGDVLHYAIMDNTYSKSYLYDNKIIIDKDSDDITITISADITKNFDIGNLLFEIELSPAAFLLAYNSACFLLLLVPDVIFIFLPVAL